MFPTKAYGITCTPSVRAMELRRSMRAQDRIVFQAVLLEITNTGQGPINSDEADSLASSLSISLPGILLCPGTVYVGQKMYELANDTFRCKRFAVQNHALN